MATRRPLIVNATANQIQEISDSDSLIGNGTIPIGGIIMWSGTIANIPTPGWALCDGSNSTPDLRNRFIVGAHSGAGTGITSTAGPGISTNTATNPNYTPGNTGGETAHQLTIAELASHTHPYNQNSNNNTDHSGTDTTTNNPSFSSQPTGSTGGDQYHENRPPYYALAFIMRTI
jgi:microcystin-dependent protein